MEWHKYLRLSYAETQDFSARRSLVGIVSILLICLLAGSISLYANGKLKTCIAAYKSSFTEAQEEEGKAGCQGAAISVGQLLYRISFTYVVTQKMDQYRGEPLECAIKSRGATINLLSFAAPQFLWDYEISCTRPATCCPKGIQGTPSESTSCFCDQTLDLHIQDFALSNNLIGGYIVNNGLANYTLLNNTISNIGNKTCPDGSPITVLRFDDKTKAAFNSSAICSDVHKSAGVGSQDNTSVASTIQTIQDLVDASVKRDLPSVFTIPDITYLCYTCSNTRDVGQVLLDLFVAIAAIGSVTYSLVLWVLKFTHEWKKEKQIDTIQLGNVNDRG